MFNFEDLLAGVFEPGTDEFQTIQDCYDLITKTAATTSAEAKTHMILLDHCRTKMSTLYYMLGTYISKKQREYQSTYDAQYTRLVKLGRPSNAAIQSEIRTTNPQYAGASQEVEDLESVRELINTYIRCLDNAKQTTMECLRDSRRID